MKNNPRNVALVHALAQALEVDLKQPATLVPDLGESVEVVLPNGSLRAKLHNAGTGGRDSSYVLVDDDKGGSIQVMPAHQVPGAPPGASYLLRYSLGGSSEEFYLGPNGVIPIDER